MTSKWVLIIHHRWLVNSSNGPEAKPCTHINKTHYSGDIVVMSFPSVSSTQSGQDDRIIVNADDIAVVYKHYGVHSSRFIWVPCRRGLPKFLGYSVTFC